MRNKKNRKRRLKLAVKLTLTITLIILVAAFFPTALSKYQSITSSNSKVDIAFYIVNTSIQNESIVLNDIEPSDEPYVYTFSISNNDGNNRLEVDASYELKIITTTNLPFTYDIEKETRNGYQSILTEEVIESDDDGMYFRNLVTTTEFFSYKENQVNKYRLIIYFPLEYTSNIYQNMVENIEIIIESKQIIE